LGEGFICIIVSAPLFYGLAALLVFIYEQLNSRKSKLKVLTLLPIILLIAQPKWIKTTPALHEVTTSKIISHPISMDVFQENPDFMKNIPLFFQLGFPKPLTISGEGIEPGDTRSIRFSSSTKGIGILKLEILAVSSNEITFKLIDDTSHISHWLRWHQVKVTFERLNNTETLVTWSTTYSCELDPQWYFVPLQKLAVDLMHKHLINSYLSL